jgi:thiol-disulfide isomerase/thioredoxin
MFRGRVNCVTADVSLVFLWLQALSAATGFERWTLNVGRRTFPPMKRIAAVVLSFFCVSAVVASPIEQQVSDITKTPGVSVVHLWAPWCSNCLAELKSGGWPKMIKDNPDTQFVFVSIWNAGDDGRAMLKRHEIADQPNVTILADPGPRRGDGKLTRFLDLPVTWIPTTWVFKGGDLRYALNYGEVRFDVLQQFITDSMSEWSHKSEAATTPAR